MEIWTPGASLTANRGRIFVRSVHTADLRAALAFDDAPQPSFAEITPNGELIFPLLATLDSIEDGMDPPAISLAPSRRLIATDLQRHDRYVARVRSLTFHHVSTEYRALLEAARGVVIGIYTLDSGAIVQNAKLLKCVAHSLNGLSTAIIDQFSDCLLEIGSEVLAPIEGASLFIDHHPLDTHKAWWSRQSNAYKSCSQAIASINKALHNPKIAPVVRLLDWLQKLKVQLSCLHLCGSRDHKAVMLQASAWFAAASNRCLIAGRHSIGLLYLHRSVEWLMMSRAAAAGFLSFTSGGAKYTPNALSLIGPGDSRPAFKRTQDLLAGVDWRGLENDFDLLNKWRNLSPLTHYLSVPADNSATALAGKIMSRLPDVAGSPKWREAFDEFSSPPIITLADVLDPDGVQRSALIRCE